MNTATAREEAFTFGCEGEALVGLLHHPAADAPAQAAQTGVVVIVGGPQYRAGSHRQFVHLARALAAAGHPVLRFDVRGMGDSTGALRNFEHITPDVGAAIDALVQRAPAVQRVVLWGLCDGASAALLYLHDRQDERVQGLCLLNPWVRSDVTQARTQLKHYYTRRLREREFWVKLLTGRVAKRALSHLVGSLRAARGRGAAQPSTSFQSCMLKGWLTFGGEILVLLSGNDYTAREFEEFVKGSPAWRHAMGFDRVSVVSLPHADHTLSGSEDGAEAQLAIGQWLACSAMPVTRMQTN